jgi:predicted Ser/Thr protein kinase
VDVITREYIDGTPLSEVWHHMDDEEKDAIVEDVS